jgi:hypothetical protein
MTRDFAKSQLARIQAWWPSMPATKEAVNEFVRRLEGFTEAEIEKGVSNLLDTHLEPGAPKLGHIFAQVKACRPKNYDNATDEERDTVFGYEKQQRVARELDELHSLEQWMANDPEAPAHYEALMVDLLQGWPEDRIAMGRRALHPSVLRRTFGELGTSRTLRMVR